MSMHFTSCNPPSHLVFCFKQSVLSMPCLAVAPSTHTFASDAQCALHKVCARSAQTDPKLTLRLSLLLVAHESDFVCAGALPAA